MIRIARIAFDPRAPRGGIDRRLLDPTVCRDADIRNRDVEPKGRPGV